jgi:hypothetical protein
MDIGEAISPSSSFPAPEEYHDHDRTSQKSGDCHGFLHNAAMVLPSALFLLYLGFRAKKNIQKLNHDRAYIMIAYYLLLWFSALLNVSWCCLQAWQCTPGKEVAWNLLSLLTASGMLFLEISLVAFLLQENCVTGLQTLPRTFLVSGLIVGVDLLLKAVFIFGFGVPLFVAGEIRVRWKWGLWTILRLLLSGVYGFILFVHYSKWRDKLPLRPTFYKYILVMFAVNLIASFASALAGSGIGFGFWLYDFLDMCYHSLYLPFLYVTFLADLFQAEDLLLDNAYYSEMKDAGFFDADWD